VSIQDSGFIKNVQYYEQGKKENHESTKGRKHEKDWMKVFLIILPLIILTNHIQSHAVS